MDAMTVKKIIDELRICAMEGQYETVRSVSSLGIRSIADEICSKCFIAGKVRKATTRAVEHPVMIWAVSHSSLTEDEVKGPIAIFVRN